MIVEYPARRLARLALVLALCSTGACGVDRDYEAAVRANTIVALDDYLRLHPDGTHAADVRARLAALVEDREWQRARGLATIDAYQQYLRGYPQGAHAKDALVAIADLNLAALPSTEAGPATPPPSSTAAPTASVAPSPPPRPRSAAAAAPHAASTPAPRVAALRPAPSPSPSGTRIQVGAFATDSAAKAASQRLVARHPELGARAVELNAATTANGRHVIRLQLGGFDRESATSACAALAKTHDPCLVVPPAAAASH